MEDRRVDHVGPGHLELDERGDVRTEVTDPQGDPVVTVPELLEGPDGTTWAERLEVVGVAPFARRHRGVLTTVAAAVAIALAGSAIYVGTRPPPDDGVVAVTVEPANTSEWNRDGTVSVDGVMTLGYRLTPTRSTDTLQVLALVGPAVVTSSVRTRSEVAPGRPVLVDVSVVAGCDDPRSVTATLDAYALRVRRTDAFGREVTGVVPLERGSESLLEQFLYPCATEWLHDGLRAESLRATVDPRGRFVHVAMVVRSSLPASVTLDPCCTSDRFVAALPASLAVLPPGGVGTVETDLLVLDCSAPRLWINEETDPYTGAVITRRPGLPLSGSFPVPGTDGARYGDVNLPWPDGGLATIEAALAQACPPVT